MQDEDQHPGENKPGKYTIPHFINRILRKIKVFIELY